MLERFKLNQVKEILKKIFNISSVYLEFRVNSDIYTMANILLVEDNKMNQVLIRSILQEHEIKIAENYEEAIQLLESNPFDLAILDVMLPGRKSGLDICSYIRSHNVLNEMEVIILSVKDSEIEKVHGLELGADDYLAKPIPAKELKARVNARLRRVKSSDEKLVKGPFEFHLKYQQAFLLKKSEKEDLHLTPIEFRILLLFSEKPKYIFSETEIIARVKSSYEFSEKAVAAHMSSLRKKVSEAAEIVRVKNKGFYLEIIYNLPISA